MIRIKGLQKSYESESVLSDVDLEMEEGEFAFLQGRSGRGKSTLLKVLYRETEKSGGTVELNGKDIDRTPKHVTRRDVGVIFQSFELLEQKTALENIAIAGEILGKKEAEIRAEALHLLERVGLQGKEHRFPHQLSGGEGQRVAIARALLNRPKILLADEPTGNLDRESALAIMELLQRLNREERITMLVVTHAQELMGAFPARRLVLDEGGLREE